MTDERDEMNSDIAKIRDALQRNLAQGHFDLANEARRLGDREEDIRHLALAGFILVTQKPLTIKEKIIYAPPSCKSWMCDDYLGTLLYSRLYLN